jgi:glycosyltransferase involved in cell wall biosynthesis
VPVSEPRSAGDAGSTASALPGTASALPGAATPMPGTGTASTQPGTASAEPETASALPGVPALPDPTLDVTIVVPYYNPGERLRSTVAQMVRVLDSSGMRFEIIAVSDGSTDGSPFTLEGFPESIVRRLEFAHVGKGHALREGLAMGRGRYLGFIDADGDISPEFLAPFVSVMQAERPDIIIGSKRHPGSSVHYPPLRRLYSWGYQHLIHLLFRLNVKDTQVGIKLVDRAVIADVLPLLRESRFALDLELLVVARRLGYSKIVEAPVRIEERFTSTISLRAVWSLLIDTLAVFWRLSVVKAYDPGIAALRARRQAGGTGGTAGGH